LKVAVILLLLQFLYLFLLQEKLRLLLGIHSVRRMILPEGGCTGCCFGGLRILGGCCSWYRSCCDCEEDEEDSATEVAAPLAITAALEDEEELDLKYENS
jgi:hypothetical protein